MRSECDEGNRIDRDFEREHRPRVTLIRKAGGVLQQRIPERLRTTHDVGDVRCTCSKCRKVDPSRDEDAKVVREQPLDGRFDIGGES